MRLNPFDLAELEGEGLKLINLKLQNILEIAQTFNVHWPHNHHSLTGRPPQLDATKPPPNCYRTSPTLAHKLHTHHLLSTQLQAGCFALAALANHTQLRAQI